MSDTATPAKPHWWNDTHHSFWENLKGEVQSDWEATKSGVAKIIPGHSDAGAASAAAADAADSADASSTATAGSTNLAAAISDETTAAPNSPEWHEVEHAISYGVGAAQQHTEHTSWDEKLEAKLKDEWTDLKSGKTWDEAKHAVKHGWDVARAKVASIV